MAAPRPVTARTLTAHCLGCGTLVTYQVGQQVVCRCKTPGQWRVSPLGLRPVPPAAAELAAPGPSARPPARRYDGTATEDALYRGLVAAGLEDLRDWTGGEAFVPQYAWGWYLTPKRKFQADFAFPAAALLVEIEGQPHAIKGRRKDDVVRRQLAEAAGWRVLSVLPEQVKNGSAVDLVRQAIAARRTS
jgi:hypothetical protein